MSRFGTLGIFPIQILLSKKKKKKHLREFWLHANLSQHTKMLQIISVQVMTFENTEDSQNPQYDNSW